MWPFFVEPLITINEQKKVKPVGMCLIHGNSLCLFPWKVIVFMVALLTLELMGNNSPTLPINTCTPIYLTVVLALRLMSSMCITERANQKKKK